MHDPIMIKAIVKNFFISKNEIYLDCTYGCGGHSFFLYNFFGKFCNFFFLDKDLYSGIIAYKFIKLKNSDMKFFLCSIKKFCLLINNLNVKKTFNVIFFDTGFSFLQLNSINRGFSFVNNDILDSRMNFNYGLNVNHFINKIKFEEIILFFSVFDIKNFSHSVSKLLSSYKNNFKIVTVFQITSILSCIKLNFKFLKKIYFKIFQAFRIIINNEIENLLFSIPILFNLLKYNGKLILIIFNSIEDLIIKNFFFYYIINRLIKFKLFDFKMFAFFLKKTKRIKLFIPNLLEVNINLKSRNSKMILIYKF